VAEETAYTLDQHASSGVLEHMKNAVTASRLYPVAFTSAVS
jgi:hypothetical protein